MNYPTLIFPIIIVALLFWFFYRYKKAMDPRLGTLEWVHEYGKPPLSFSGKRYPMEKKDALPLILITILYGVTAFWGLGDMTAPQTFWQANSENYSVTVNLGREEEITQVMYYTGLYTGGYDIEFSLDGKAWSKAIPEDEEADYAMSQKHSELFKWRYADLGGISWKAQYVRITARKIPLELGELAFYGKDGQLLDAANFTYALPGAGALFDEQDVIPDHPDYLNSAYFDEIYHARTAYEHLTNVYPYEVSHPPLGKIIIMLGIKLFGMTPFGWRFMGTLFGVLMLPFLYILLKNMFGKTPIAVCGTLLFAFDFMHFVQTRIATIDTYGVFFILLSYLFMYRYITCDNNAPFSKTAPSLFLSGLFWGIGCATKWTVVYAGAGLAVLYAASLILRGRRYYRECRLHEFWNFLIKTLGFSVLSFIIVPVTIYCLSYIPYGLAKGMTLKDGMLWNPDFYKIIWDNQVFMLTYHQGVTAAHPYASKWWMWLVDARPILYYLEYMGNYKSSFGAFNNPLVSWGGLLAMIFMALRIKKKRNHTALFILIGYLSQLLPWVLISRVTFAYHYFPSTLFLVLAISCVFNDLYDRNVQYRKLVYGFTVFALGLFIMFYPELTGLVTTKNYSYYFLKWFPSWPFS